MARSCSEVPRGRNLSRSAHIAISTHLLLQAIPAACDVPDCTHDRSSTVEIVAIVVGKPAKMEAGFDRAGFALPVGYGTSVMRLFIGVSRVAEQHLVENKLIVLVASCSAC